MATQPMEVPDIDSAVVTGTTFARSARFDKLVAALAKAQAEIKNPARNQKVLVKTKTGGQYNYEYADLAAVLDAVKPALTKNEVVPIFACKTEGSKAIVTTILAHSSGQWISTDVALSSGGSGNQDVGGAITYGKRYGLSALTAIAADDDDDANGVDGKDSEREERSPRQQPQTTQQRHPIEIPKKDKPAPLPSFAQALNDAPAGTTAPASETVAESRVKSAITSLAEQWGMSLVDFRTQIANMISTGYFGANKPKDFEPFLPIIEALETANPEEVTPNPLLWGQRLRRREDAAKWTAGVKKLATEICTAQGWDINALTDALAGHGVNCAISGDVWKSLKSMEGTAA